MLEQQQSQLVTGLQELYRRSQSGQGWVGDPLKEGDQGNPLTHDILERLGSLKQDGRTSNESFEEDLDQMQRSLIANGAGFMQREASSDGGSDDTPSPIFDQLHQKPLFTDPFAISRFPPTPPNQSPYPRSARMNSSTKAQNLAQQTSMQSVMNPALLQQQAWNHSPVAFDDNMDFLNRFESPASFDAMSPHFSQSHLPLGTMNPCLAMRDWAEEDDFQKFFNPTLI